MELEQTESGLVVPKQKPKPPARKYGPLEIQDEQQRAMAAAGLSMLWDAIELSRGTWVTTPQNSPAAFEAHEKLYRYIGEVLLGRDCPEKEVLT